MNDNFDKIKTPEELLNFMSNIKYGYLGKSNKIFHSEDINFNRKWFNEYILQNKNSILKFFVGTCWDQVELERTWFSDNKYEFKTIYEMVNLDYENDYPTHSFLVYKDKNDNWNWFENSDINNKGIHTFSTLNELLTFQYNEYVKLLKQFGIFDKEIEKIELYEFDKPKENSSAEEYIEHALNSKCIHVRR